MNSADLVRRFTITALTTLLCTSMLTACGQRSVRLAPGNQAEGVNGVVAAEVLPTNVTAKSHEESKWGKFVPQNVVDGDTAAKSSWRAEGHGQWIQLDLGRPWEVVAVRVAFVGGKGRQYSFHIETSLDGQQWRKVYQGKSSGKTTDYESIDIEDSAARYVRFVGAGNTKTGFEEWINITELQVMVLTAGP